MSQALAAYLRAEADRHMQSAAWLDGLVQGHVHNLRRWALEVDAHEEVLQTLIGMTEATERWNASVEQIIGRQPDSGIDVARARAVIAKVAQFEVV
jgi:hypothetical protein